MRKFLQKVIKYIDWDAFAWEDTLTVEASRTMKTYLELKAEWSAAMAGMTAFQRIAIFERHGLKLAKKASGQSKPFKVALPKTQSRPD